MFCNAPPIPVSIRGGDVPGDPHPINRGPVLATIRILY